MIQLFLRTQTRDELMDEEERKQHFLRKPQRNHHTLLVPPTESNNWNNNTRKYRKKNLPSLLTGTQSSRRDTHTDHMRRHLRYSSLDRALYPWNETDGAKFNPVNVPILDMLAVEAEKEYRWKYPSEETIRTYQDYRGLSTSMLRHCKTEEIILNGNQTEKEQKKIISWYHYRMGEVNATMSNSPLSLDVEQVRCTLQDVLRLAEQVPYHRNSVVLSDCRAQTTTEHTRTGMCSCPFA